MQERSKLDRGHSSSLPTMGGPGMVPPHNYAISYRPGLGQLMGQSMPMGQMGPSLARVPSGLSNDLGPPIFMPCEQ